MKTSVISFTSAQSSQEVAANILMEKINDFLDTLKDENEASVTDIRYISNTEVTPRGTALYSVSAFVLYTTKD